MTKILIPLVAIFFSISCYSQDYFDSVGDIYFDVYQDVISPTKSSVSNCQFSPSCSQFAKEAIDEYGLVVGLSMFGDRFQRCSGGMSERNQYPVVNGLYHDPPLGNELFGTEHIWKAGLYTYRNKFRPISDVQTYDGLDFAFSLFKEEDYSSSLLELKRELSKSSDSSTITPLILSNYLLSNKKKEAINMAIALNSSDIFDEDIFILTNVTTDLVELYRWNINYISSKKDKLNNDTLSSKFLIYNYLKLSEFDKAKEVASVIEMPIGHTIEELESNSKSPVLAASLSTVIPGAGYIYCGEVKEGLSAMVINGLLGFSIYTLFKNENYSSGALVSLISFPFYFGNIVGSANMAESKNLQYREQKYNDIRNDFEIAFYFSLNYFETLWQKE